MEMNLPNSLTLARIVMIPIFGIIFFLPVEWSNLVAAIIFALAAFTDWLDGWLARRLEQTSAFGAFLDPVADKLMVAVALVALTAENPSAFFALPAAVIIGREIAVSALREWMAELGKRANVAVNVIGKFKTAAQMIAILLLIYSAPVAGLPTTLIGLLLLYAAAALTLWSMIVYLRAAWLVLEGEPRETGDKA
ncbi:CDP-diacylglycerol--glycerol-3-phosphate 3-phosphatidyltransferase [Aquisalimonas asiatica]|uniref:CDP-diacylglycerol--glycerol-3-phosphate 3-phosphatidyltransferase n=1 Tax=Aquisalimonas asiatica TaxID=406100 RepID=A0A1H8QD99_9GAMM|nr:CDP-diacylglycerol--glycerol-3-phosphate 3-phosphatidyltransferase [Aquisalimonas asiatica]SEO52215.1 CDP-diacylglycerol--glycerol-3-phosphate 3-phosphatidyltransferase [Aquisalimonas asiatica]